MNLKYICLIIFLFFAMPVFAQTFDANDFSDFKSAIATAESSSNENHRAIYVTSGKATISNSQINNNTSTSGGGALYTNTDTTVILDNISFESNNVSTGSTGGAITGTTNSTTNISSRTQFIGNKADGLGGGIFSQGTININANNPNLIFLQVA